MELATFNQFLTAAVKNGASDVHLKAGGPPALRINGALLPVKVPALMPDRARRSASRAASTLLARTWPACRS